MNDIQAIRAVVRGRVQAVGYRISAVREARSLGLVGRVRNLPSGDVEVFAQGLATDLERMISWLHSGPPAAYVQQVDVQPVEIDPGLDSFEIAF